MTAAGWLMTVAGGVGGWAQQPATAQAPAKQSTGAAAFVDGGSRSGGFA